MGIKNMYLCFQLLFLLIIILKGGSCRRQKSFGYLKKAKVQPESRHFVSGDFKNLEDKRSVSNSEQVTCPLFVVTDRQ